MPIEFRPLVDDTYYRDVKGIFSTAFAKHYDRYNIISSWYNRSKDTSFAFYDTDRKKVIGFAMMHRTGDTMLYLSYIAMADDIRGKGTGTLIMKRLLKYAAKEGCSMTLTPFSSVIPWYESMGFTVTHDKFNYVFHQYRTRKNAKFIDQLFETKPALKTDKITYDYISHGIKCEIKNSSFNPGWKNDVIWYKNTNPGCKNYYSRCKNILDVMWHKIT